MKKLLIASVMTGMVFTGCSPNEYQVSRTIEINAPAAQVFEIVNDFHHQEAWSPWEKMDPAMTKSFEGSESGVGAVYKWSGNDSVGTGSMKILESTPNSYILCDLNFTAPWESSSTIEWNFTEENGVTRAEWINTGSMPGFMFWMGDEDMEEMMGPTFEQGLGDLKTYSEERSSEISSLPVDVLKTNVSSMNYYFVEREVQFSELNEELYSQAYDEVFSYLGEDAADVKEPVFAVFHEWDEENEKTRFEIAVAVDSDKPGNENVKKGTTYSGQVVMRIHEGSYEGVEAVHEELYGYLAENNLQFNGSPWESYVVGPGDEADSTKWITEVYYPVAEVN